MTKDQSSTSTAGGVRKKSEFDWDSPPGKALAELFKSLTTIRTLRRAVKDAEASVNHLEFELQTSIREIKRITPTLGPDAAISGANFGGLLTEMEVAEKLGISKAALIARMQEWPPFPDPIHVSSRKYAYRTRDIDEWMESESKRVAYQ